MNLKETVIIYFPFIILVLSSWKFSFAPREM